MNSRSFCAPRAVGPRVQFNLALNRVINDQPEHATGHHLLSLVQAATNNWVSIPSISQPSQIKEDTVKPSVPAWEFNSSIRHYNLTQMIRPGWALNPVYSIIAAAGSAYRDTTNSATRTGHSRRISH